MVSARYSLSVHAVVAKCVRIVDVDQTSTVERPDQRSDNSDGRATR